MSQKTRKTTLRMRACVIVDSWMKQKRSICRDKGHDHGITNISRFRPTFPVSAITSQLAFDSESEALEFLPQGSTIWRTFFLEFLDLLENHWEFYWDI